MMQPAEDIRNPFDREAQFAAKRRAVISSAAGAFRRQGYHNTSMAQIAKLLGLKKPALYYYVSNKEEILFESHIMAYDAMDSILDAPHCSGSSIDHLAKIFRAFVDLLTQSGVSLLTDVDSLTGERQAVVLSRRAKIEKVVTLLVKAGQSDGTIRGGDPRLHVFFFMGALNWLNAWFEPEGRLKGDDIADHFVAQLRFGIEAK